MSLVLRLVVVSICVLVAGIGQGLAADWSDPGVPPNSRTVWVADALEHNGVPMRIRQLSTLSDVETVLDFYRRQWADPVAGGPGYLEKRIAGWRVISRMENGRQVVVQVRPAERGGTEGFISQADFSQSMTPVQIDSRFPHKSGTRLISRTVSRDGAGKAVTLLLSNDYSVETNRRFYEDAMARDGWSLVHGADTGDSVSLLFNRSGEHCDIGIARSRGRTVIVANLQEE